MAANLTIACALGLALVLGIVMKGRVEETLFGEVPHG
jgi:hypothetical protein